MELLVGVELEEFESFEGKDEIGRDSSAKKVAGRGAVCGGWRRLFGEQAAGASGGFDVVSAWRLPLEGLKSLKECVEGAQVLASMFVQVVSVEPQTVDRRPPTRRAVSWAWEVETKLNMRFGVV